MTVWGRFQRCDSLSRGWPHFLPVHSWLALSPWDWSQPYLPLSRLPASVNPGRRCDTASNHTTAVSINLISCRRLHRHNAPMTALLFGIHCGAAMPGIAVIYIKWGTVRKGNSWKQAENEIITVIKPAFHILHHRVSGKRGSLDGSDGLWRHRGPWTHVLTENIIITCLPNRGNSQNTKITKQGVSGMRLNSHWTTHKRYVPTFACHKCWNKPLARQLIIPTLVFLRPAG